MLSMTLTLTKQEQTSKNNIYIVHRPSPHLVSFFLPRPSTKASKASQSHPNLTTGVRVIVKININPNQTSKNNKNNIYIVHRPSPIWLPFFFLPRPSTKASKASEAHPNLTHGVRAIVKINIFKYAFGAFAHQRDQRRYRCV